MKLREEKEIEVRYINVFFLYKPALIYRHIGPLRRKFESYFYYSVTCIYNLYFCELGYYECLLLFKDDLFVRCILSIN